MDFPVSSDFLDGQKTNPETDWIAVFPEWLMDRYQLHEKPFKLLDENFSTYGKLRMPSSEKTRKLFLDPIEEKMSYAFKNGYKAIRSVDELTIFQWFSKLLYGIVWVELQAAFSQNESEEPLGISPSLISKFSNLHLLMQSINQPLVFEDFQPWSLIIVPLASLPERFDYRDDMSTMIFSLALEDFGLIICLQDHEHNKYYHKKLLQKIEGKQLDSMQFQELCARFYYSAYLFNPIPEYLVIPPAGNSSEFTISPQPLEGAGFRSIFNTWDNKMYAQVLEAFWKPWQKTRQDILTDPQHPRSALLDEGGNFKD